MLLLYLPFSHWVSGLLRTLWHYVIRLYISIGCFETVSKGYLEVFNKTIQKIIGIPKLLYSKYLLITVWNLSCYNICIIYTIIVLPKCNFHNWLFLCLHDCFLKFNNLFITVQNNMLHLAIPSLCSQVNMFNILLLLIWLKKQLVFDAEF